MDSTLVGQNGLPPQGAGSHDADLLAKSIVIDERSDQAVSHHLVAAALGRLTQEHRDVLRELYLRGSSVAQAARLLGIEPGTVKSRAYYALRALRLAIEELGGVD